MTHRHQRDTIREAATVVASDWVNGRLGDRQSLQSVLDAGHLDNQAMSRIANAIDGSGVRFDDVFAAITRICRFECDWRSR